MVFAGTPNAILNHVPAGYLKWRGRVGALCGVLLSLLKMNMMKVGGVAFVMFSGLCVLIVRAQFTVVEYPLQSRLVFLLSMVIAITVFSQCLALLSLAGLKVLPLGTLTMKQGIIQSLKQDT